jgi:hypothetical protein
LRSGPREKQFLQATFDIEETLHAEVRNLVRLVDVPRITDNILVGV